ncbi:MAG: thiol-disulfide isomerase [Acidobacteriota bacterium]|nr:thiol-disulfide isomerase [Acidobacteriota bacterium]
MKRIMFFSAFLFTLLTAGLMMSPSSQANESKTTLKSVTFTKDVAPIFYKSCAECHRAGETAPFSVLSYKEVRPWAKAIKEKVVSKEMPPWHADPHFGEFKNNPSLTQAEINTISAWVDGGAAEGNPKDLPPAPKFVEGWRIGKPDVVLSMREEFTLAASGPDEYQYFAIPTNFTEDKYVQMSEARPGNRKIVHHILAFVVPPGGKDFSKLSQVELQKMFSDDGPNSVFYREGFLQRVKMDAKVNDDGCNGKFGEDDAGDVLAGYAPGMPPEVFEPGVAKKIPAGATLIFQLHYSKVAGSVQKDRSSVGLIFAKEAPKRRMIKRGIENIFFKIPAGAEAHKATACWQPKEDITVYSLMPHMHYRGAAMEYKATYPDGKTEVLLNVPNYDFGWQTNYALAKPKFIPKGTMIQVTATFNNSAKNKYNPDPTKDVRWGDPTYDEMLIGYMDFIPERKTVLGMDAKALAAFVGKYDAGLMKLNVVQVGGELYAEIAGQPRIEMLPEAADKFYIREIQDFVTFTRNEKGEIIEAAIQMGNRTIKAKKKSDSIVSQ